MGSAIKSEPVTVIIILYYHCICSKDWDDIISNFIWPILLDCYRLKHCIKITSFAATFLKCTTTFFIPYRSNILVTDSIKSNLKRWNVLSQIHLSLVKIHLKKFFTKTRYFFLFLQNHQDGNNGLMLLLSLPQHKKSTLMVGILCSLRSSKIWTFL